MNFPIPKIETLTVESKSDRKRLSDIGLVKAACTVHVVKEVRRGG